MTSTQNGGVDGIIDGAITVLTGDPLGGDGRLLQDFLQASHQPSPPRKRRWGNYLSQYWCFGYHKQSKRVGHAVLVPEPTIPTAAALSSDTLNHTITVDTVIAPPPSPADVLQPDPASPNGLLSLASLSFNAFSPGGTAPIFRIGPYAHETQLVSPPVFSDVNTEPSTAAITPPTGSVQPTAPSSPEVPFAQLLASSFARNRNRRNGKTNMKFSLSQYEFQSYQYLGSPGSNIISPSSVVSASGTSSPFPDKHSVIELHMGEASKFIGYDHFTTRKWGSRLGSGSLTPSGLGSRLDSGTLTPNGGLSRLGSGTLTPTLDNASQEEKDVVTNHRVSFELTNDEFQSCLGKNLVASEQTMPESDTASEGATHKGVTKAESTTCEHCVEETIAENSEDVIEGGHFHKRTITLGSSKDFNFDNREGEGLEKSIVECIWWKNETVIAHDVDATGNSI